MANTTLQLPIEVFARLGRTRALFSMEVYNKPAVISNATALSLLLDLFDEAKANGTLPDHNGIVERVRRYPKRGRPSLTMRVPGAGLVIIAMKRSSGHCFQPTSARTSLTRCTTCGYIWNTNTMLPEMVPRCTKERVIPAIDFKPPHLPPIHERAQATASDPESPGEHPTGGTAG